MWVLATEPPMRIEGSFRKICAVTVNMASYPQFVLYSLGNTMSVRTSDIETDISRANGLHCSGGVP